MTVVFSNYARLTMYQLCNKTETETALIRAPHDDHLHSAATTTLQPITAAKDTRSGHKSEASVSLEKISTKLVHTLVHVCMHTHTYTYKHTHMYIHTHTCTYIHIHTHMYTHKYILTCVRAYEFGFRLQPPKPNDANVKEML